MQINSNQPNLSFTLLHISQCSVLTSNFRRLLPTLEDGESITPRLGRVCLCPSTFQNEGTLSSPLFRSGDHDQSGFANLQGQKNPQPPCTTCASTWPPTVPCHKIPVSRTCFHYLYSPHVGKIPEPSPLQEELSHLSQPLPRGET